jgi:hypothetical protein
MHDHVNHYTASKFFLFSEISQPVLDLSGISSAENDTT